MRTRKVAIFDIDGTIFRSSLLIELTEALIADGVFPAKLRNMYRKEHAAWLDRQGNYDGYIRGVVRAFDASIKGVSERAFLRVVRDVVRKHERRVYRYTRDLIRHLKARGYYLLAISHSPGYIVHGFGEKMGFDKVYGRMFEVGSNGKFTGAVLYLDMINDKEKVLLRAAEKEKLTLKDSYGVGDSESDIQFLKHVAHPICFNPNSALYREARRRKWHVVVERKDVVYKLS